MKAHEMTKSASRPYSDTPLVHFLDERIQELRPRKTQSQIATEAGFSRPNMLSMIKAGSSKLPLKRVRGLAKALECDVRFLFFAAVQQSGDLTLIPLIEQIFGDIPSDYELVWLQAIRIASGYTDPELTLRRARLLREMLNGP
jgi:transcriptional regulator with XRE-family HTH domain